MAKFGRESKRILATCHEDIVFVMDTAIQYFDFKVLSGQRGEEEQNKLHREGASLKAYPDSAHNAEPLSDGIDIAPYPIDWKDEERFILLAGVVWGIGKMLGIELIWGGDWDRDTEIKDTTFRDFGHFQRVV